MNSQERQLIDGITVIIPAFNEHKSIRQTIEEVKNALLEMDVDSEIIVIDDCSNDNTSEILKKSSVKYFCHEYNRGYGASLKTGIKHAKYETVVITDADGTYPNNRIPDLVKHMEVGGYDMVVGSRTGEKVKVPLLRRIPKWILNKLANYLVNTKIPDINSGLRIMKKANIKRFDNILPDGFSFTTTLTLAMLTHNMRVHYIPINYYRRQGKSKIRPFYDTLTFFQLIIRTILYFNPLKIFVPISLSLVVIAFVVLFGSWFIFGKAMDVTFGVIIMTAVIVMSIGMLADLIDKRL